MLTEAGHPLSRGLSPRHHVAPGGVDELRETKELGAGTLTLSSRGPFLHQLAASWDTLTFHSESFVLLSIIFYVHLAFGLTQVMGPGTFTATGPFLC